MTLLTVSAARSLARRAPLRQVVNLLCRRRNSAEPAQPAQGPALKRMRAVGGDDIDGHGGDAGHGLFVLIEFAGEEAALVFFLVPGGMAVVAEDQLGADARDLSGGLGGLGVAEVAEELHGTGEAFGGDGIVRAVRFELEHVEDLGAGGEQPAERVGQREGHTLALTVIELVAGGVGGVLQMVDATRARASWPRRGCRRRFRAGRRRCGASRAVQARNWARKSSEVMVTVNWRRWTASGPS